MDENTSLINIGELSRPATVLIEKISDAVGGIFKPYQIIRVAKAEAQADRVRTEGEIEISDLQRRAFHRFLEEEAKKQKNIEDITQKALPLLNEDSKPDDVEDDWIVNFFDRCRLISDDEMQGLWSRVLAGQANLPGTYSKRTVNFLSGLDKSDAELFMKLCDFAWLIEEEVYLIIFDQKDKIYTDHGINFEALTHLEAIGLIQFFTSDDVVRGELPSSIIVSYFEKTVELQVARGKLIVGSVILTKVGRELAPICGSKPVSGFLEYVSDVWEKRLAVEEQAAETSSTLAKSDV
jgi:hypothetical protein